MSEATRSRFYDWLCEQTDEPMAEYVMSCLSPMPWPELATKDDLRHLEAAFVRLEEKFEADRAERLAQREADRAERDALREADRKEHEMQRKADRAERLADREADRKERLADRATDRKERLDDRATDRREFDARFDDVLEDSRQRFRWLVGLGVTGFAVMLASMFALAAITLSAAS